MNYSKLNAGETDSGIINVVIEIPRGSGNKYEFDKELETIVLDRVQPTMLRQPYDYGFIPKTLGDDGDPLDAMIVIDEPLFPGVVVASRIVGMVNMVDDGDQDEKLVCVAAEDKHYEHVTKLEDLGTHFKDKVAHYFERYKDLQNKTVKVTGWGGVDEARDILDHCIANYQAEG